MCWAFRRPRWPPIGRPSVGARCNRRTCFSVSRGLSVVVRTAHVTATTARCFNCPPLPAAHGMAASSNSDASDASDDVPQAVRGYQDVVNALPDTLGTPVELAEAQNLPPRASLRENVLFRPDCFIAPRGRGGAATWLNLSTVDAGLAAFCGQVLDDTATHLSPTRTHEDRSLQARRSSAMDRIQGRRHLYLRLGRSTCACVPLGLGTGGATRPTQSGARLLGGRTQGAAPGATASSERTTRRAPLPPCTSCRRSLTASCPTLPPRYSVCRRQARSRRSGVLGHCADVRAHNRGVRECIDKNMITIPFTSASATQSLRWRRLLRRSLLVIPELVGDYWFFVERGAICWLKLPPSTCRLGISTS